MVFRVHVEKKPGFDVEAQQLTNAAVAEALDGLPPVKMHCSLLAEEAVKAALDDYHAKQGKAE